jgi:hypothetical protein
VQLVGESHLEVNPVCLDDSSTGWPPRAANDFIGDDSDCRASDNGDILPDDRLQTGEELTCIDRVGAEGNNVVRGTDIGLAYRLPGDISTGPDGVLRILISYSNSHKLTPSAMAGSMEPTTVPHWEMFVPLLGTVLYPLAAARLATDPTIGTPM